MTASSGPHSHRNYECGTSETSFVYRHAIAVSILVITFPMASTYYPPLPLCSLPTIMCVSLASLPPPPLSLSLSFSLFSFSLSLTFVFVHWFCSPWRDADSRLFHFNSIFQHLILSYQCLDGLNCVPPTPFSLPLAPLFIFLWYSCGHCSSIERMLSLVQRWSAMTSLSVEPSTM